MILLISFGSSEWSVINKSRRIHNDVLTVTTSEDF